MTALFLQADTGGLGQLPPDDIARAGKPLFYPSTTLSSAIVALERVHPHETEIVTADERTFFTDEFVAKGVQMTEEPSKRMLMERKEHAGFHLLNQELAQTFSPMVRMPPATISELSSQVFSSLILTKTQTPSNPVRVF